MRRNLISMEYPAEMFDADDELVFLDESVEMALINYFFGKGH